MKSILKEKLLYALFGLLILSGVIVFGDLTEKMSFYGCIATLTGYILVMTLLVEQINKYDDGK